MATIPSPEWQPRTKRLVSLIFFIFVVIFLWMAREILPIITVSILIAYILNPLVSGINRHVFRVTEHDGARRGIATLLTFAFAIVLIIVAFVIIIPVAVNQVQEFGTRLPELLQTLEMQLEAALAQPIIFNGEPILIDGVPFVPLDRIEEATGTRQLSELLRFNEINLQGAATALFNSARNLSGPAFSFFGGAFNTLINVTFLLMMTFYLLKDGNLFLQSAVRLLPSAYHDDGQRILKQLANVWDAYVRGQLILCIVMGFTVYFAALVLGVPNAPMLGLLAGVLEFIPNLGPFIALIPAAFLALVSESATITGLAGFPFMLAVIVVWTGLQNLESIFLVPRIMGDSLDLHPFVVIIGVLVGAALVGPLGVILAAPLVASIRVLLQYGYRKLVGLEPFTEDSDKTDAKPNPLDGIVTAIRSLLKGRPGTAANRTKG